MKRTNLLALLSILAAGIAFSQAAKADDWGCQVLLCLADPNGPTNEKECRPPIEKLWKHLARGKSFPSCTMAGDSKSGTGSYARQVYEPYDPCPSGTVPTGGFIAQSSSTNAREWRKLNYRYSAEGRNDNGFYSGVSVERNGPRACVSNHLGNYRVNQGGRDGVSYTVSVYQNVIWQQRKNPRAIDVFVDGQLQQRVRY